MPHTSAAQVSSRSVPEALAELAELVDAGDLTAARRVSQRMLGCAEPRALTVLTRCAAALRADADVAAERLRRLWRDSDPADRAIIEACVPDADYRPDLPTPGIDHYAATRPRYVAAGELRITRRAPSTPRPRDGDSGIAGAYERDRGGVDEQPESATTPIGYELDYDRAGVPALRGTPCLQCWIERSSADQRRGRRDDGRWDDGLCQDCRDRGRPGIPELPAGHTRTQQVGARCEFIATHAGAGTRPALRQEYRRANRGDRAVITAWVAAHTALIVA